MAADDKPNEVDDKDSLNDLVRQLRSANENLVLATIHAQTMKDEAEAANRRQNEFLAMLAHELRNPLAPISMATALLERIADSHPDLPRLHGIIHRQTEQMASLLNDLLDAARISSGRIVIKKRRVMLSEVLDRAIETCQPNLQQRQQMLQLHAPASVVVLDGDPVRLGQVFSNLLLNASKFSPDNSVISMTASVDDGWLSVVVSDQGIGISAEVLPRIFDLFVQGPRSLARSEGGLGIGLNVVRSLVHMHGGSVEARSEGHGQGSSFTIMLPCLDSVNMDDPAVPKPVGTAIGCRMLVIEDNVDANRTLADLLSVHGHVVQSAFDGPAGLAMAKAENFDAIVCDIGLPGLDGFSLVTALRASAGASGLPLLVAVTGYGQPDDRQRALEAGFDHFMVKPVSMQGLLALLDKHVTADE